jgi:hypothetical protein
MVDFDLLMIKEQIASAPPPVTIQARENFIDQRLRRRAKKSSSMAIDLAKETVVDPMENFAEPEPAAEMIDLVEDEVVQPKQKAKKKVVTDETNTDR